MRGCDDVPLRHEGASAPELPPALAVEVDGGHPGVLALKGHVAADDAGLRDLSDAAFWEKTSFELWQWNSL